MIQLRKLVVTSVLCLSATVALADNDRKPHGPLKGHTNLIAAEKDLAASFKSISKSQEANECVFGLEGGHGAKAKEAIEAAAKQVWEAAEWVNTHEKECGEYKPAKGGGKKGPKEPTLKGHPALKGHPNLIAAEKDLIGAYDAVVRSQEANECVFGVEGGHGQKAKEAIDVAFKQVTEAAEWVNTHENECKAAKKK
jgi:uncharacterized protein (DUF1786 family)